MQFTQNARAIAAMNENVHINVEDEDDEQMANGEKTSNAKKDVHVLNQRTI